MVHLCAAKQPRSLTGARLGVGACLWDGAFVLTAYIAAQPANSYAGKLSLLLFELMLLRCFVWQESMGRVQFHDSCIHGSTLLVCIIDKRFTPLPLPSVILSQVHAAGKRCIELGAGVGLVGLALARLGAKVTLTDKPALLGLLRGNVAKNWLGERPPPGYYICIAPGQTARCRCQC